jgi:hypothetical protein
VSWNKITNVTTGEVQYVASLDGVDLDGWTALAIAEDRCPEPHEEVAEDGTLFVPLDWAKADLTRQVNELKNAKQNGTVVTPSGVIDGDDSSKIKLNGLVNMALLALQNSQPFSIDWTLADNSTVTLDANQAIQMGLAAGQYVSLVHDYARTLKDQIDSATSVADLEAIDITAGWP